MDHGGHMDHGGMDHGDAGAMACKVRPVPLHAPHLLPSSGHSARQGVDHTLMTRTFPQMSMIWNTDPVGHCLVFPSLQITPGTVVPYLTASTTAASHPIAPFAIGAADSPIPSHSPRRCGRIPAPLPLDL